MIMKIVSNYYNIISEKLVVGAKVQNLCVLDLRLARVQTDKYWILILIREPEFPRRYE